MGQGRLQDAPGAAKWSVSFFIVFMVLRLVLVTMNYELVMRPYFD